MDRKELAASLTFVAVLAGFAVLWYVSYALVPLILGALFGIFLFELSALLRRSLPLSERWAVAVTLVLLVVIVLLAAYVLGRRVADQFSQLLSLLPQGLEAARGWIARNPRLSDALRSMGAGKEAGSLTTVIRGAGGFFRGLVEAGIAAFIVFFSGVFLALSPGSYSAGLLRLLPRRHRARGKRLLSDLWRSLWLWTLGRLVVMLPIAIAHIIAYWLLGVPLPVSLGLIAGVLAFIPFLGPVLATVPAGLVALTKSPMLMVWVIVVHAIVETLESHLLTPVTQEYFVDVPALMTIAAFIVFGATMGLGGVLIATPMSAALIVIVRDLYLEESASMDAL